MLLDSELNRLSPFLWSRSIYIFFPVLIPYLQEKLSLKLEMTAADSKHAMALTDEDAAWDVPPPYELHSSGAALASSCIINRTNPRFLFLLTTSLTLHCR